MILALIIFCKYFLPFLYLINKHLSTCLDHSKLPLLFYGFSRDNNSVLDSIFSLKINSHNNLVCDNHLYVLVHKAELYHTRPDSKANDVLNCTELLRSKCLEQKTCSIGVNDCNSLLENKRTNIQFLNVEYSCEQSKDPKPIFNGLNFREGCFGDFLIIASNICQEPIHPSSSSLMGKRLKSCLSSPNCKYVTADDQLLHYDDFFSKRDKIKSHSYLKADQFNITGYAVLLNHTAVCDRPIYVKTTSIYELAKQANSAKYSCFSIAYTPSSLFNLNKNQNSWICRGYVDSKQSISGSRP